jgi:thiamine phosphate synthase YjbQ (UPF0047 family)
MDTSASTFIYRHTRVGILTEGAADLVDLTDGLDSLLTDAALRRGVINVRALDDGTGIVVATRGTSPPLDESVDRGASVPIRDGRLQLGTTERVFLVDLAGPGARQIAVVMVGEGRR